MGNNCSSLALKFGESLLKGGDLNINFISLGNKLIDGKSELFDSDLKSSLFLLEFLEFKLEALSVATTIVEIVISGLKLDDQLINLSFQSNQVKACLFFLQCSYLKKELIHLSGDTADKDLELGNAFFLDYKGRVDSSQ